MTQYFRGREIGYLPAVLLRHFAFPTDRVRSLHDSLISDARAENEEYPVVGFGFTEKDGELLLHCLTTVSVDSYKLGLFLEAAGKRFRNILVTRTGRIVASARPAKGGDSLSRGNNSPTGTLGCLVKDHGGTEFILSCNHVIADLNNAAKGAEIVWQPGDGDGGHATDRIGVLQDFKDIQFGGVVGNDVDAAICKPDSSSDVEPGIRSLGLITGIVRDPPFNTGVRKRGWKTSTTDGEIQIKNLSVIVYFDSGQHALFDGQLGVIGSRNQFSTNGDSGSLVIDTNNNAVGLLFATASGVDLSYVNPIGAVLDYFDVNIA